MRNYLDNTTACRQKEQDKLQGHTRGQLLTGCDPSPTAIAGSVWRFVSQAAAASVPCRKTRKLLPKAAARAQLVQTHLMIKRSFS
jgi:hypothetical protein